LLTIVAQGVVAWPMAGGTFDDFRRAKAELAGKG